MKIMAGLAGAVAGASLVVTLGWLALRAGPRTAPPAASNTPSAAPISPTPPDPVPRPQAPISLPPSSDEQSRGDLEQRRAPFFDLLQRGYGADVRGWSTPAPDTLNLSVDRADAITVTRVLNGDLLERAWQYGYRRVRLMVRGMRGGVEEELAAVEATADETRQWRLFRK